MSQILFVKLWFLSVTVAIIITFRGVWLKEFEQKPVTTGD